MKNIRIFLSVNFQFLEVKFSIYLNRRVFVMACYEPSHLDLHCSQRYMYLIWSSGVEESFFFFFFFY